MLLTGEVLLLPMLVLLLLTGLAILQGYTREKRKIELAGLQSLHNCDPIFGEEYFEVSMEALQTTISEEIQKNHRFHLNKNLSYNEFEWLRFVDAKVQNDCISSILEIKYLREGLIKPRKSCNHKNYTKAKECIYFQKMLKYNLIDANIVASNLKINPMQNINGLLLLSQEFFNEEEYQYAEELSRLLLFNIAPAFLKQFVMEINSKYEIISIMHQSSKVIAECEHLNGNLQSAVFFALHSIYLAEQYYTVENPSLSSLENPATEYLATLHATKLRILMMIPSLPIETERAVGFREEMLQDLIHFREKIIVSANRTFGLDVLTTNFYTPFHLAHQGCNDYDIQRAWYLLLQAMYPNLTFMSPHLLKQKPVLQYLPINSPTTDNNPSIAVPSLSNIKIGFISRHFQQHSIGFILFEMLYHLRNFNVSIHNKQIKIDIILYWIGAHTDIPVKESSTSSIDGLTKAFMQIFGDNFIQLTGTNISYNRLRISEDELDILIYADLGMEFMSYSLAFSRLATYQMVWWGHPVTSGMDSIDFFLSLDAEVPGAQDHYYEQMIRFEEMNSISPHIQNTGVDHIPITDLEMSYLGLPPIGTARYAIVFGRIFKIHPDFIRVLASVLLRLTIADDAQEKLKQQNSYVILIADKIGIWNAQIISAMQKALALQIKRQLQRLSKEEEADIMEGAMAKVKLVHYQNYHRLAAHAKLMMDTFPYGGCITVHDAFYHNLPVVTFPPPLIRGRYAYAMYKQMNYTDLIARSEEDYKELVLRLLLDDKFQSDQQKIIHNKFSSSFHRNDRVAEAMMRFILRLLR